MLSHRVVIASAGLFLFIESAILLQLPVDYLVALFVFSTTLTAYLVPQDFKWHPVAFFPSSLFLGSLLSTCWLLSYLDPLQFWPILMAATCLLVAYRFKVFNGYSLRNHPATKGTTIAFCWTMTTVGMLFSLHRGTTYDLNLYMLTSAINFSLVLALSWLCDVADRHHDTQHGLRSIATALGSKKTMIASAMCVTSVMLVVVLFGHEHHQFMLSASIAVLAVLVSMLAVKRFPATPAKWMVDALLLCKPMLVIWLLG